MNFQVVCQCGDTNIGFPASESKIQWDESIKEEDKSAIFALKVNEVFMGEFRSGKPFAVKRLN